MMGTTQIYLGSEIKLNISIEPIGEMTMDNYNFQVEVFTSPKRKVTVQKSELIRVDSNNYILPLDTSKLGVGDLRCIITAYIPDGDFEDQLRTEIGVFCTGIIICNGVFKC